MKRIMVGFILGGIVFTLAGVAASTVISSNQVTYQNKTVGRALDELYNSAVTGKEVIAAAITNKGVSTNSSDTYETMAANINSIDTNHTEINQKISSLESKHTSDIASLTGSISNMNQELTNKNKYSSVNILALNQDIIFEYDAFIVYSVTYGASTYSGYTLKINDIIRDATAAIDVTGNQAVTRSFEIKKGDKVRLDINEGTTCTQRNIYFK